MKTYYLKTSSPDKVVAVRIAEIPFAVTHDDEVTYWFELIKAEIDPFTACANILNNKVMSELRKFLKRQGLTLREPKRMYTRAYLKEV